MMKGCSSELPAELEIVDDAVEGIVGTLYTLHDQEQPATARDTSLAKHLAPISGCGGNLYPHGHWKMAKSGFCLGSHVARTIDRRAETKTAYLSTRETSFWQSPVWHVIRCQEKA